MAPSSSKILDSPDSYTIAWIAALSIERAAAEAMLDEEHDKPTGFSQHQSDTNSYTWGRIGEHNIVIVSLTAGVYGLGSAAATASNLSASLPAIRVGLLVGIGGGIARPDDDYDIRLGDVVVSQPDGTTGGVCQYDLVKAKPGDSRERKGFLSPPPRVLLNALAKIQGVHERKDSDIPRLLQEMLEANPKMAKKSKKSPSYTHQGVENDRLFQSSYGHVIGTDCRACETAHEVQREERESTDPEIHYGIIASGNTLVKDAIARDRIVADVGEDCICFEMEAAGLMNHFPCLVIRGICDYADSHKNDRWQRYASATAAGYAKELLGYVPVAEIQKSKRALEILESVNEKIDTTQQTTIAVKATIDSMMLDSQGQKIRTWLAAPDPSTNANHARELRHAGTGAWLLENTVYQKWISGTYKHLWLRGMAGCGKTVLSTTVLDDLAKNNERIILSFFFDFSDAMKQTKSDLMRSLAIQLYQGDYDSAGYLESSFRAHENRNERPTTTTLEGIVKVILASQRNVVIVLDALDESATREEILLWLKGVFEDRELGHVRVLYTSREEAEFIRHIPALIGDQCCLSLEVGATTADIRSYVIARTRNDARLTEKGLSEDLLGQIYTKVGDGAKGMFRWAACQLDSLGECWSPREVQKALDSLPSTLEETYDRMLKRIPRKYCTSAVRLLRFIVHVKRPMTLEAAVDIIATEVEQEHPRFDLKCRMFHISDVLRHCPSLISVIEVKDGSKTAHELHLAHFSVKEYLLIQGNFGQMDASITITKTCLTYLRDIEGSRWRLAKDFPLAEYAASVFLDFAAVAEASDEVSTMMINFFQSKKTFNRWKHLLKAKLPHTDSYNACFSDPFTEAFRRGSVLYFACFFGLRTVARLTIDAGVSVNSQGVVHGNLLWTASYRGHLDIVQLLLDNNADTNSQDAGGGTSLRAASRNGYLSIVQLLLDRNADINAHNDHGRNALHEAAENGHFDIVRLLLDRNANIKALDSGGYTALEIATSYGHLRVAELLLDKCEDANVQRCLDAASVGGHLNIVELLLNKYANIDVKDTLWAASIGGHLHIVELLLEKHPIADVEAALAIASEEGHFKLVELLLKHARDFNAPHGFDKTALDAAISSSQLDIIQLLLKNGAYLCKQSASYLAATKLALERGHHELVRVLLDVKSADVYGKGEGIISSLLPCAVVGGKQDLVQLVIGIGADINTTLNSSRSALEEACFHGHESIVKMLLELGADVNGRPGSSCGGPLQAAILNGHGNVIDALREFGADFGLVAENLTPILHEAFSRQKPHILGLLADLGLDIARLKINDSRVAQQLEDCLGLACALGKNDLVKSWVGVGANVNGQSQYGNHIQTACLADEKDTIEVLIELGADINNISRFGSALKTTAAGGNAALVEMLLDLGADVNIDDSESSDRIYSGPRCGRESKPSTPLSAAASAGDLEVAALLVEAGADVNTPQHGDAMAPLAFASWKGHIEMVNFLLENGANVSSECRCGGTALLLASDQGHFDVVKLLLQRGADATISSWDGWTPLIVSPFNGYAEIVAQLIDISGIHPDGALSMTGRTALSLAAEEGHTSVVELLPNNPQVDVNSKCSWGRTSLSFAAQRGHKSVVELLLNVPNIDVDSKTNSGRTALFYAAQRGQKLVVELLLRVPNVDVDSKDLIGRTALFTASTNGHDATVDVLLKNNARVDLSDRYGSTPLSVAARRGHMRVIEILLASGATSTLKDHFGRTPIWWAKKCGKIEVLRVFAPNETQQPPVEIQQPQATDSESNMVPKPHPIFCSVCDLTNPRHSMVAVCPHCCGGNFFICKCCFDAGASCLQESHLDIIRWLA